MVALTAQTPETRTPLAFLLLVTLAGQLLPEAQGCGRGSVYITNNEYRQILIAISDNVPENSRLLTRITEIFTEASAFLYQVTKYVLTSALPDLFQGL